MKHQPRPVPGVPRPEATPSLLIRSNRRFGWTAAAIFLVALTVRLLHVWQIRKAPFFTVLMGDARGYDDWAQQIARGDWLGHEVFYQAPLYPYFLGALYTVAGHNLIVVRACQAIIGSFACVLVGLAGWHLFSKRTGLIGGFMLALYAPAIFFDGLIQKSVLDVFFMCLMLWLIGSIITDTAEGRATRTGASRESWRLWLCLGLATGGLSLTRENALVFTVVILAWALTRLRNRPESAARPHSAPPPRRLACVSAFLVGVTLVLLPVAVRNRIVGDQFYLTTSQFGPNFYIGNNPRSDGTYMSLRFGRGAPEYERQDATALAEHALGRRLTPAEVSRYWTDRALAFIRSQPSAWLQLMGRKVLLLVNATEMLDTESQYSYAEWSAPIRFAGRIGHFGILMPLALFGVWATWPERARLRILFALAIAYAASVAMFYVFARYRFPMVPFLVLFASAGLARTSSFLREISLARAILAPASVVVAAVLANWPVLSVDLMRAITENNLGVALQSEGRVDEATNHYRRAIAFRSDYAPAYNNMGSALRATGRPDEAVVIYERALGLQPDYPEAHYNLGNALLDLGKPSEAIDHFQRALRLAPGSVDMHNNLGIALAAQGKLDDAIREFREALRVDANSAKAHRNLGDALASQGARNAAIDQLRQAVQLEPADGLAHYDLGSVLLEAGKLDEAIAEFHAALKHTPNSADLHNNLGIALGSQGKLGEAIDQFQEALRIQPGLENAQRNLTMALQARRQPGNLTTAPARPGR